MVLQYKPPPYSEKLGTILNSVDQLRPLPTSVMNILRALDNPDTSVTEIARLFELDQALTVEVLHTANSAGFGYSTPCTSVPEAVMRLGFNQIRTAVMRRSVSSPLSRRLRGYRLGAGALWNHSIDAAQIARLIAKEIAYPHTEEAYVAGLLHDMGKLLLDQFVLEDYHKIVRMMEEQQISVWQAEEKLFGIDHARMGGMMAVKWNLPNSLVDAIQHHHLPSLAWAYKELGAIVNIANAFTPKDSTSLAGQDGRMVNPIALEILHLDLEKLDQLWARISQKIKFASPAEDDADGLNEHATN